MDLGNWNGAPKPEREVLEGFYTRLEPLETGLHAQTLFEASVAPGVDERFRYLREVPPSGLNVLQDWIGSASAGADPLFFAVIDKATGRAEGRQSLMRVDTTHGVVEIGHIMWGPAIARTRVATEALFLFADYAFRLGYRRFEWKCDNANVPSKRAAERFGFCFEGIFRQHMVIKGRNRDTAWFAIMDGDWPRLRAGYVRWLKADNFDSSGRQLTKLMFDP